MRDASLSGLETGLSPSVPERLESVKDRTFYSGFPFHTSPAQCNIQNTSSTTKLNFNVIQLLFIEYKLCTTPVVDITAPGCLQSPGLAMMFGRKMEKLRLQEVKRLAQEHLLRVISSALHSAGGPFFVL